MMLIHCEITLLNIFINSKWYTLVMEIKTRLGTRSAGFVEAIYKDIDSYDEVGHIDFESIGAVCLCGGKLVVVYDKGRERWTPIGGKIEAGESLAQAVEREIKEESNMKVIRQIPLGYQTIFLPDRIVNQTRTLCIVEPHGPFIADPDGDISEIKLIDPKDYKEYFDYGEIQDHIMKRLNEILSKNKIEAIV